MSKTTNYLIGAILMLVFILGCVVENFWPANQDPLGKKYVGDNNEISMLPVGKNASNLANARILKNQIEIKHTETQNELIMKMNTDNSVYAILIASANNAIKNAEASFNAVIGSFSQPGWLGALALGWGVKVWKEQTLFNQQEVDELIKKKNDTPSA